MVEESTVYTRDAGENFLEINKSIAKAANASKPANATFRPIGAANVRKIIAIPRKNEYTIRTTNPPTAND